MKSDSLNPLQYSIRRSSRSKTTRIIVKPDKIEVIAPPSVSEQKIKAFVTSQEEWIRLAIRQVSINQDAIPSLAPTNYNDGCFIPFQGKQIKLSLNFTETKKIVIHCNEAQGMIMNLPLSYQEASGSTLIRLKLIGWMRTQARLEIENMINRHAPRFGLFPRSLKIKTQKSRWGSCGPNNDINMNWLLILAPGSVLEYVVVHELCHIKHKNHSKAFWDLVAQHLPAYHQQRLWLKQNGASLMKGL